MDEKLTTAKLNLDFLKQRVEADYMDGDIMVLDDIRQLPAEGSLQTDMLVLLVCLEGKLQVDVNGKSFTAVEGDMLVGPPNVFLDNYMISPAFNAKIIGLSYEALQRMLNTNKYIWDLMLYLAKHPVCHMDDECMELLTYYYQLLAFKLKQGDRVHRKDVMHALFQAVFFDMCSILAPAISAEIQIENSHIRQGDILMKRFLKMLADSQGRERSVTAFADRLCITPKYLTTACKASSGKTALEWIHEYTIEIIVQQLKYSDRSIKEISDSLNFPNISFFGKFVKARLGVSPTEFRKRLASEEKR